MSCVRGMVWCACWYTCGVRVFYIWSFVCCFCAMYMGYECAIGVAFLCMPDLFVGLIHGVCMVYV